MGIKKLFKTKPPPEDTYEQNREELMTQGIEVKSDKQRKDKFSAFRDYARNKNENRSAFKPRVFDSNNLPPQVGPYMNHYTAHSYDDLSHTGSSPYSNSTFASSDTRINDASATSPYNNTFQQLSRQRTAGLYGQQRYDPYMLERQETRQSAAPTEYSKYDQYQSQLLQQDTNLNETPLYNANQVAIMEDEEEDLNAMPSGYLPPHKDTDLDFTAEELERMRLQQEEDDEIDQIKHDIKFTKQQSVLSTRNTLRMAEELYASGQNTLGMLGSQSERLYGIEKNLLLADVQTKMAEDKTKEMVKLNRSIFAVHASNPFNSKRKMKMQEEKIKQARLNQKLLLQQQRQDLQLSERRVISGLKQDQPSSTTGEIYAKYNDKRILDNAKRYQFENDEEDDDMEREIHQNITSIGNHATNLRKMAMTIGRETEDQNKRMVNLEDEADKLDINVHLNSHRLNQLH